MAAGLFAGFHGMAVAGVPSFASVPSVELQTADHTATVLPTGSVLVAGGFSGTGPVSDQCYLIDPYYARTVPAANLARARQSHTALLLPTGHVLVSGGWDGATALANQELYNASTEGWTEAPVLATPRSRHSVTLLADGRVLIAGGENAGTLGSVEIYSADPAAVAMAASLSVPRSSHTATLLSDGRVLVAGGGNGGTAQASVEVYDPASATWSVMAPLAAARSHHGAVRLDNGKILVIGGLAADGSALSSCELYDPSTGQWTGTGPLQQARARHATVVLPNGRVRVLGGEVAPAQATASAEEYNPATGLWAWVKNGAEIASMAQPRSHHTATLLPTGRTLVIGGAGGGGVVEMMSYNQGSLNGADSYPTPSSSRQATLLADGRVLVTGGAASKPGPPPYADDEAHIFDYRTQTWSAAAPMMTPRESHTATLLKDGRVLVTGGTDLKRPQPGFWAESEIYNPINNTWISAAPMKTQRSRAAAVSLADGRVLVIGGHKDKNLTPLQSAEIYNPLTNTWTDAAPLPWPANYISVHTLRNGLVWLMNCMPSEDRYSGRLDQCATFDPAANLWAAAPVPLQSKGNRDPSTVAQLADGRILSSGERGMYTASAHCEIYDPLTNQWTLATPPAEATNASQAMLLPDGTIFSKYDQGIEGHSEIFDPITGRWSLDVLTNILGTKSIGLPNGDILIFGGVVDFGLQNIARLYNMGMGYQPASRPSLTDASIDSQGRLVLSGTGFRGHAGPSSSPADHPLVRVWHSRSNRTVFLVPEPSLPWTDTSFVSSDMGGLPDGHAFVTVLVNGIPGESQPIYLPAAELVVKTTGNEAVPSHASLALPSVPINETATLHFTLHNAGAGILSGLSATMAGNDASAFSVSLDSSSLLAGASTTLGVNFSSSEGRVHSGILRISSNDPLHSPFIVNLTATAINSAPVISGIDDLTINENGETGAIHFTISDANTSVDALVISAVSDNQILLPNHRILIAGTGAQRAVNLMPSANRSGTAVVTITVSDGALSTSESFTLSVTEVNDPPSFKSWGERPPLRVNSGAQRLSFTNLSAGPNEVQPLSISVTSDNPALFASLSAHHPENQAPYVEFVPAAGRTGRATISVVVSDGLAEAAGQALINVLPEITIYSRSIPEGGSGHTAMPFTVEVSPPHVEPIRISYQTISEGTATPGVDYIPASGMLEIPPETGEAFIEVQLAGDTQLEFDETFGLAVEAVFNADFLQSGRATGTILNDDAQPALNLTQPWVTVADEGAGAKAWIAVTLPAAFDIPVTWVVSTRSGTAEAGGHFTPITATELVFAPGETTKWLSVDVRAGSAAAGEKQFYVDFTSTLGPQVVSTSTSRIKRMAITDFYAVGNGAFLLRFPGALGQSYVIEESSTFEGPWVTVSPILIGGNGLITQALLTEYPASFFRVVSAPRQP